MITFLTSSPTGPLGVPCSVPGLDNTVTLDFGEGTAFTLWGAGGIEQMGERRTLTVELLGGEGKFLEMKTYEE